MSHMMRFAIIVVGVTVMATAMESQKSSDIVSGILEDNSKRSQLLRRLGKFLTKRWTSGGSKQNLAEVQNAPTKFTDRWVSVQDIVSGKDHSKLMQQLAGLKRRLAHFAWNKDYMECVREAVSIHKDTCAFFSAVHNRWKVSTFYIGHPGLKIYMEQLVGYEKAVHAVLDKDEFTKLRPEFKRSYHALTMGIFNNFPKNKWEFDDRRKMMIHAITNVEEQVKLMNYSKKLYSKINDLEFSELKSFHAESNTKTTYARRQTKNKNGFYMVAAVAKNIQSIEELVEKVTKLSEEMQNMDNGMCFDFVPGESDLRELRSMCWYKEQGAFKTRKTMLVSKLQNWMKLLGDQDAFTF